MTVTDDEILDAMRLLARHTGVFAEPAGATAFAGLRKMLRENALDNTETVVVMVTGNGLKDIDTAIRAAGSPTIIEPDFADVKRAVNGKDSPQFSL